MSQGISHPLTTSEKSRPVLSSQVCPKVLKGGYPHNIPHGSLCSSHFAAWRDTGVCYPSCPEAQKSLWLLSVLPAASPRRSTQFSNHMSWRALPGLWAPGIWWVLVRLCSLHPLISAWGSAAGMSSLPKQSTEQAGAPWRLHHRSAFLSARFCSLPLMVTVVTLIGCRSP